MKLAKIIRGIRLLFEKVYWSSEKKELKHCGENSYIEYPFILIGGDCISIGNNFHAYKHFQLEAHKAHNGNKFAPEIKIGNNVSINYNVHIGAINQVIIGDNVLIASKVFITDHHHGKTNKESLEIPPSERILYSKGAVVIRDNVWIGENVSIMPGVTIGKNSVIGANSVVTHDIPENCIAAGNPAKIIK